MAFHQLKEALTSEPILAYPSWNKPFILATDASQQSLGAVLSQMDGDYEHPVAYASRKLNPAKTRYSTTEKELLAVVWAARVFQEYLLGKRFTLETDRMALTAAMKL